MTTADQKHCAILSSEGNMRLLANKGRLVIGIDTPEGRRGKTVSEPEQLLGFVDFLQKGSAGKKYELCLRRPGDLEDGLPVSGLRISFHDKQKRRQFYGALASCQLNMLIHQQERRFAYDCIQLHASDIRQLVTALVGDCGEIRAAALARRRPRAGNNAAPP